VQANRPEVAAYVPGGQSEQFHPAVVSWYVPGLHWSHDVAAFAA
jgi:hypothetical protein